MSIETIFSEHRLHASMNICTGCDWRPIADNDPLADQHEAHLADLIRDALTGDEAVEAVVDALVMDPISDSFGTDLSPVVRAARAAIAALVETIGGRS